MGLKNGIGKFTPGCVKFTGGGVTPTHSFNFMTGQLPADITFTRASSATYYNSSGILTTAGNNVPRFDYDPATLLLKGLLIEASATNQVINSVMSTSGTSFASGWATGGTGNVTVSANAITAPDGTLTATKLLDTITSGTHLAVNVIAEGNVAITFSAYFKAAEYTQIQIEFTDQTTGGPCFFYTLTGNGTVTNITGAAGSASPGGSLGSWTSPSGTIQKINNGWYRCTLTCTKGAGTNGVPLIALDNGTGGTPSATFAGTGTSGVYVWGSQQEVNPFATSLMPTAGSTATRATDFAPVTNLPWFNAASGTIVANIITEGSAVGGVFSFDDGSTNNRVDYRNSQGFGMITGSGVSVTVNSGNFTPGVPSKIGVNYSAAYATSSLNGSTPSHTGAVTLPVGVTTLNIGALNAGSFPISAWYKSLSYWNYQFPDAKFQQATT